MKIATLSPLLLLTICASCAVTETTQINTDGWGQGFMYANPLYSIVKLPEDYDATKQYPLLVTLHGNGGTADSFAPAFSGYAQEGIVLAVPQGAYAKLAGGYSWYYLTSDRSLWEEYDSEAVSNLMEAVNQIKRDFSVGPVFVLGFSQGASMAYFAGLLNPSLVTGVLAIGGQMPEVDQEGSIVHAQDIADAQGVKLFIAHGTNDPLVPQSTYTNQVLFFKAHGYDVTTHEYDGGHYLTAGLLDTAMQWMKTILGE